VTRALKAAIWLNSTVLIMVSFVAGCGMNRRYANNVIRQLPHSEVAIEYAYTSAGSIEGEQSASPSGDSTRQVLSITYPHPSPKYGRKYAEVLVRPEDEATDDSQSNAVAQLVTNPFKKQEALAAGFAQRDNALRLTIPREELEFLLRDLVADSYFDREDRSGGVALRVTLGSRTTQKAWDHIASFDQLARRVAQENGQRLGSRHRASNISTASAELLPPDLDELRDGPKSEPKRRERLHALPEF
jgi:hypothetical protein